MGGDQVELNNNTSNNSNTNAVAAPAEAAQEPQEPAPATAQAQNAAELSADMSGFVVVDVPGAGPAPDSEAAPAPDSEAAPAPAPSASEEGHPVETPAPGPLVAVSALASADVPFATKDKVISTLVTLRTAEVENDDNEPPIDISLVLDVSGSMQGDKLKLAKKTTLFVAEQLRPCDRLGLITYDTHVSVIQELTPMTDEQKAKFATAVRRIHAGSQTNLSGGVLEALQQMKERPPPRASVSSVFLVTDGLANVGIKGDANIIKAVGGVLDQLPATDCPSLYSFGIGADHNADLLRGLSEAARAGTYYFIENEELIPESFASALGGLLSVVAQNITVTIEALDGHTIERAPFSAKKSDVVTKDMPRKCTVRFGDIFSEEKRDMLLDVKLPALEAEDERSEALKISLSYFDVERAQMVEFEKSVIVRRPNSVPEDQTEHPLVISEKNRTLYYRAVSEATVLADRGDHEGAKKIVEDAIAGIRVVDGDDATEGLLDDLKDTLQDISSRHSWNSGGKHYTNSSMMMNCQQRSTISWDSVASPRAASKSEEVRSKKNRYGNKKKGKMMMSARAYAAEEE